MVLTVFDILRKNYINTEFSNASMEFNLVYLVSIILVLVVFWLLSSLLIREVVELFKVHMNTFHKSNNIAFVLTAVLLFQFLFSGSPIAGIIFLIIFIAALFLMIWKVYGTKLSKTIMIGLSILLGYVFVLAVVAAIIFAFSNLK
jgi:hypothetical protein